MKKLTEIFERRANKKFENDDSERYVKAIDKIIHKVYNDRYDKIWKKMDYNKNNNSGIFQKKFERGDFRFSDGRLRIDPYVFQEKCWMELEDKNLIQKNMAKTSFINDAALVSYIHTIFKNILQNMIDGLSPWFDSRKKQVGTILNENCDKVKIAKNIYYELKSVPNDKIPEPADIGKIQEAATLLNPPPMQFSKKLYSEKGPSVSKKEMKKYLLNIMENAGGMIIYKDLLKFIKKIYGYTEIKQAESSISYNKNMEENEQSEDNVISNLLFHENHFEPTADHLLMADDIVDKLTPEIKQLIYYWKIKELKGNKIAANMNVSTVQTIWRIKNNFGFFR